MLQIHDYKFMINYEMISYMFVIERHCVHENVIYEQRPMSAQIKLLDIVRTCVLVFAKYRSLLCFSVVAIEYDN